MSGTFPYIAIVRRDHDFRVAVETSHGFPFDAGTKEEARWLALDWWGNCFVERFRGGDGPCDFQGSTGDVSSYACPAWSDSTGQVRCVFLTAREYRPFGFNPFRAIAHGVFDFTETFYKERDEMPFHINWKLRVQAHMPGDSVLRRQIGTMIAQERTCSEVTVLLFRLGLTRQASCNFERFAGILSPDVLGESVSSRLRIGHVIGWTTLEHSWLHSTVRPKENVRRRVSRLVPVDERGSPFKTIRRAESDPCPRLFPVQPFLCGQYGV